MEIEIQDVDRARGLIELPESLIDVTSLLGKDFCEVSKDSSFVITGRGGIPASPYEMRSGEVIWLDLRLPATLEETRDSREPVAPENTRSLGAENTRSPEIVEAQGWYINSEGVVVLTANPTVVNPQNSGLVHPQCHLPGER